MPSRQICAYRQKSCPMLHEGEGYEIIEDALPEKSIDLSRQINDDSDNYN